MKPARLVVVPETTAEWVERIYPLEQAAELAPPTRYWRRRLEWRARMAKRQLARAMRRKAVLRIRVITRGRR